MKILAKRGDKILELFKYKEVLLDDGEVITVYSPVISKPSDVITVASSVLTKTGLFGGAN